jgi:cell division septation protein DedD
VLKLIFTTLLCANAALLAYGQGWLGTTALGVREPERIARQANTDKLQLLSAAAATAAPALPTPVPAPAQPDTPAPAVASVAASCTEIGNFGAPEARRFDDLIAPLTLGNKLAKTNVTTQEITIHMVMIPPQGSKEAADKKAAELKEKGVSDFYIMNDSPAKWGISLGAFKSEAAAKTLLAALNKQGVTGARIAGRSSPVTRLVYRFTDIDPAIRARLKSIADKFDEIDLRSCK